MGTDKRSAHSRIDAHEQVCSERYGNINQQLTDIKEKQNANATVMHERLNKLSERQHQGILALLAVTAVAFWSVAVFWINAIVGKH